MHYLTCSVFMFSGCILILHIIPMHGCRKLLPCSTFSGYMFLRLCIHSVSQAAIIRMYIYDCMDLQEGSYTRNNSADRFHHHFIDTDISNKPCVHAHCGQPFTLVFFQGYFLRYVKLLQKPGLSLLAVEACSH